MTHALCVAVFSALAPLLPGGAFAPQPARPAGPSRQTTCEGQVTAVDDRSITIRGFDLRSGETWRRNLFLYSFGGRQEVLCTKIEQTRHLLTLTLPNGEVMRVRREDMPVRRFPVGTHLAAGGFDPAESAGGTYRLADIRVGDEVTLWLEREGPEGVCRAIQIDRRPGGRVPRAPGQKPDDTDPYDGWVNAFQDWEERGIPLPDRYNIEKIRERGRRPMAAPQAPPPREAKPKPPTP